MFHKIMEKNKEDYLHGSLKFIVFFLIRTNERNMTYIVISARLLVRGNQSLVKKLTVFCVSKCSLERLKDMGMYLRTVIVLTGVKYERVIKSF